MKNHRFSKKTLLKLCLPALALLIVPVLVEALRPNSAQIKVLKIENDSVSVLANPKFLETSDSIVVATNSLKIIDLESQISTRLERRGDYIRGLAIAPNRQFIASVGKTLVCLWDYSGRLRYSWQMPGDDIFCVAFSPKENIVAIGGWYGNSGAGTNDGVVYLLKIGESKPFKTIRDLYKSTPVGGVIRNISFSPDGKDLLTSGTLQGYIKLWDVQTGRVKNTFNKFPGNFGAVFTADGRSIIGGDRIGKDYYICQWNLATDTIERKIKVSHRIDSVVRSLSGQILAIGTNNSSSERCNIFLYDFPSLKLKQEIEAKSTLAKFALTANGSKIAVVDENTIKVYTID